MNTSRTGLRSTAYHIVVASSVPWIRNQGRGGGETSSAIPASMS